MTTSKIKNIQSYHSVAYSCDKMTMWQHYNRGPGKSISYSDLYFKSGV